MPDPTKCPHCGRPVVAKRVDACLYCGASLRTGEEGEEFRGVVKMDDALKAPATGTGYTPEGIGSSFLDWDFLKYVLFGLVLGGVIFTVILLTMKSVRKATEGRTTIAETAIGQAEEAQRQNYQRQMDVRRNLQEAEGGGTSATSAKQLESARTNLERIKEAVVAYGERNGRYPDSLSPDAFEIAWLAKTPYDFSSFVNRRIHSYRRFSVSDTIEAFELTAIAGDGQNTELCASDSLRLKRH